jgi:hypothetical protein
MMVIWQRVRSEKSGYIVLRYLLNRGAEKMLAAAGVDVVVFSKVST